MKTLFIGIFDGREPNTEFRNSIKRASSHYREIAHNAYASALALQTDIIIECHEQKFDLVFMQLQGPNIIGHSALKALKSTGAFLCQWTGDARQPLPRHYVDFGKQIDLSLFTNTDDVVKMRENGCNADYLQVSADHNIYNPEGSVNPNVPEIVFMGNYYKGAFELSDYRLKMCEFLRETYGQRFGIYGGGYPPGMATDNLMFNQQKEAEVYRSCKIAINCSHYDLGRYTSDRFFRILLSGAFCLSKEFPDMEEYSPEWNYQTFDGSMQDLKNKIDTYLEYPASRKSIAYNGLKKARANWKWEDRIKELLTLKEKYEKEKHV